MCGQPLGQMHHVIKRSQGGGDEPENLVPICYTCHRRIHDEGTLATEPVPNGVLFIDKLTGSSAIFDGTPHLALHPSQLTTWCQEILELFDLGTFAERLKGEPDEVLTTLYDQVREIKYRSWQLQSLIIAELQSRCQRGDAATQAVADKLNVSQRTVQRRGQIYREILSDPECADVGVLLPQESWYQEAVMQENPKEAILYAADRKAEDPKYTIRQFRAELGGDEKTTLTEVIVVCREGNAADVRLCERLELSLGVPVHIETMVPDNHQGTFIVAFDRPVIAA